MDALWGTLFSPAESNLEKYIPGLFGGGTERPVALLARSAILLCNGAQAAAAGGVAARVRAERARGGGAADVARRGGALL